MGSWSLVRIDSMSIGLVSVAENGKEVARSFRMNIDEYLKASLRPVLK